MVSHSENPGYNVTTRSNPLLKIMDYSLEAVGVGLPRFPIVTPIRILLDHSILTK